MLLLGAGWRLWAGRHGPRILWWWGPLAVYQAGLSAAAFWGGYWAIGVLTAVVAVVAAMNWWEHWRLAKLNRAGAEAARRRELARRRAWLN